MHNLQIPLCRQASELAQVAGLCWTRTSTVRPLKAVRRAHRLRTRLQEDYTALEIASQPLIDLLR